MPKRPQREIVYVCSELSRASDLYLPYVFTDGHAYIKISKQFNDVIDLNKLNWDIIKAKQWSDTEEDNDRQRRKEAEFLIYQHVPVEAIISIVVYDQKMADWVSLLLVGAGVNFSVHVLPKWYY